MSHAHNFKIKEIKKLPDWEAEIIGEIPVEYLAEARKEAIKYLNEKIALPGFRSGKIPEDVLVKSVGEMRVLEETAEVALAKQYGHIVEESKLRPVARPMIAVTKLAPGIPLEFKMTLVLEPEFELPDYKKIGKSIPAEEEAKKEEKKDGETSVPQAPANNKEKRRLKIIDALVKETKFELPKKLVDAELFHMLGHFKQDIEKAGIDWNKYLEQIKKTEEQIREDWRENVVSRAKTELILSKIAEKEKLKTYGEVFEMLES